MKLGDRLDGHIVQGHVDQTATCTNIKKEDGSTIFTFTYDYTNTNITTEKGSITVNGVTYQVTVYELAEQEGLYKYEFTKNKIVDPYLSFYVLTKAQPSFKNLIDKNPSPVDSKTPLPSLVSSYVKKGYRIIDDFEETVGGDKYKVVYLTNVPSDWKADVDLDLVDYVGIFSKNNIVYSVKNL